MPNSPISADHGVDLGEVEPPLDVAAAGRAENIAHRFLLPLYYSTRRKVRRLANNAERKPSLFPEIEQKITHKNQTFTYRVIVNAAIGGAKERACSTISR
jgi:hypothetical protein